MLNKINTLLFLLCFTLNFNSQNLVKNGSFELTDFWKCATNIQNPINSNDPYGKLSFVTSYYQPEYGMQGLLTKSILTGTCAVLCSALTNTFIGYKLPHSGNNLLGGIQEYASFQLSSYLIKNKQYIFECYFSGSNKYKSNTPFSFYRGSIPIQNWGSINLNDSTTGWFVVDLLKNPSEMFQAKDGFIISNIKKIDTLGWTKVSACFSPKIDSVSYVAFHSNISAFMDDIAIYPAQNFNIQQISPLCNKNIQFKVVNPLPNYLYTYNFGDSSSLYTSSLPILNHTYNNSGVYNGFLIGKDTISNQFFCSTTTSTIAFVQANFTYPLNVVTQVNTEIINTSINGQKFSWSLNDSFYTNQQNPQINFNSNKNKLCLKALNKEGCVDSLCKDIYVEECGKITNANIFTPNDDGVNDFYYFFDSKVCDSTNIKIIIYNRWGEEFYRYPFNELYKSNETSKYFKPTKFYTHKYWNGFSDNIGPKKADDGVYFILIETPYERKTKTITLIR
jgi:hypothetical protein